MSKLVELTTRATKDLERIKDYCTVHFGEEKADQIIDEIFDHIAILESPDHDFASIGMVDEDFTHLKREYRKIFSTTVKSPIGKANRKST